MNFEKGHNTDITKKNTGKKENNNNNRTRGIPLHQKLKGFLQVGKVTTHSKLFSCLKLNLARQKIAPFIFLGIQEKLDVD